MPVLLLGTLDTKSAEYAFVRDLLHAAGLTTLVADTGVLGPPAFPPDIPREHFFALAGADPDDLRRTGDRGRAVEAAARAAALLAAQLHAAGSLDGVLALGGSAGTTIGTAAMRALPLGVPKLMVSTLAAGQVRPYVGVRDVLMLPSVVDIAGLNRVSRAILANAAAALAGMVQARAHAAAQPALAADRPLVVASMFGVTTPCVDAARARLDAAGCEVLVFHATGAGGQTMESFLADGLCAGSLDLTTTELADELVGGILTAGPDRLTAAGRRGTPQILSLGALDMVNFGPPETVPERFQGRRFYRHNPTVTLMRTTPDENALLGREIARKANDASGPTAVLVPLRGVSAIDREGQPFWWPEADQALFQALRDSLGPRVRHIELDLHINDPAFARAAAELMLDMMASA